MNTEILTDFEKTFKDVAPIKKSYPIHQHGYINYYTIDDSSITTDKILESYDEHSETLGIG